MRLRSPSRRKSVHRYDDLDYHDHYQDEVQRRTSQSDEPVLGYRGPVVEYNPKLRPAVFPTVPLDQVHESPEGRVEASPLHFRPTPQPLIEDEQNTKPSSQSFDFSTFKDPEMFARTPTYDRVSRNLERNLETSLSRTPSPKARRMENTVFLQNLKLLNQFSKRTETDWNVAGMETSDEDEAEQTKENPKELVWDIIAVAQRLCIVDVVDECCKSLDTTFRVLRLNADQKAATVVLIEQRNRYIDAEETALQMVRDKASEILLSGNEEEIDCLSNRGGYAKLMEDNVYIGVGKIEYLTSTSQELRLAKRYLATCGFKPELLDHWASESTVKVGSVATSTPEVESSPAAFPTIPFDQYEPREILEVTAPSGAGLPTELPVAPKPQESVRPTQNQREQIHAATSRHFDKELTIEIPTRDQCRPPAANFPKRSNALNNGNHRPSTPALEQRDVQRNTQEVGKISADGEGVAQLPQNSREAERSVQLNKAKREVIWHGHGHGHYSTASNRSIQTTPSFNQLHPEVHVARQQRQQQPLTNAGLITHHQDQRAKTPMTEAQRHSQLLDDPRLTAQRRASYHVSALAQKFALPPQPDQHRRSWIPNTAVNGQNIRTGGQSAGPISRPSSRGLASLANDYDDVVANSDSGRRQNVDLGSNVRPHSDPRLYTQGESMRRTSTHQDNSAKYGSAINTVAPVNGPVPESRRSPTAQMPAPPRPAQLDISMIDPTLRQPPFEVYRSPTPNSAAQQYRHMDLFPPHNAGTSEPRKRSAADTMALQQADSNAKRSVTQETRQDKDHDGEFIPPKVKRRYNRRKTVV